MTAQSLLNHVTITGNYKSSETLLFCHGFGTDQTVWDLITPAFSERYRIVLLDNMGSGNSDPASFIQHRYLKLSGYVEDLKAIITELDLQNMTIIGHSVGAMIAALTSIELPERLKRLVMIGASPCYRDRDDYLGGFEKEDIDQIYDAIMMNFDQWVTGFTQAAFDYHHESNIAKRFSSTLMAYDKKYVLTVLCSIFQNDYRQELAKISVPTLLIHSEHDFFVPSSVAYFMQKTIPSNQLAFIKAHGHFPHLTNAHDIVVALEYFFRNTQYANDSTPKKNPRGHTS